MSYNGVTMPVTAIVYSSDVSSHVKNEAMERHAQGDLIWLCDGTADDVEIQAAIDAGGANSVVKLLGAFTVSSPIVIVNSYQVLDLHGASITMASGNQKNIIEVMPTAAHAYGIKILGGLLDGNQANQTDSGTEYLQNGIMAEGDSGTAYVFWLTIEGTEIKNCYKNGIALYGYQRYAKVQGCYTHNNLKTGIRLDSTTGYELISNHTVYNTFYGIFFEGANYGLVSNNHSSFNTQGELYAYKAEYINFVGGTITNAGAYGAIWLQYSSNCNIVGINMHTKNIRLEGHVVNGNCDNNVIVGNTLGSVGFNGDAYINNTVVTGNRMIEANGGTGTIVRNNSGYVTENSGTATVANGQTTITVTHGLATTPTRVQVTPTLLSNAASFWVTAKGATTFVINVNVDPGAGTATFDWRAVIGEGN